MDQSHNTPAWRPTFFFNREETKDGVAYLHTLLGSLILTLVFDKARAVISFCILSANLGNKLSVASQYCDKDLP